MLASSGVVFALNLSESRLKLGSRMASGVAGRTFHALPGETSAMGSAFSGRGPSLL